MRWLCFLLLASPSLTPAAIAQTSGTSPKSLQFDVAQVPATRDAFLAGAVSNVAPGDSLAVPAYKEFDDSLVTLSFTAESPTTIEVPAGRFDVLPLRSGGFRIYATRTGPRRVVKGETLDGAFAFELVRSGPVVPTPE